MKKTAVRKRAVILAAGLLAAGAGGAAAGSVTARAAAGDPLVFICPDTQGHASVCANGQELEVFDKNGAPVFSVGETGGPGTFGDNSSVFGPGSVFSPALVQSYATPAAYNRAFGRPDTCTAPEAWMEPHGIWACTTAGTWVKRVSF